VHFDWLLVVTIRRAALAHGKAVRRMTLSLSKGPATVCFTRLNFFRSLRGTFALLASGIEQGLCYIGH